MNQADRDHEQWLKKHQEYQYRKWIQATESGDPYHIDQHGDVIIEKEKKEENK